MATLQLAIIYATCVLKVKSLVSQTVPSTLQYAELTRILSTHYKPAPAVIAECYCFQKRNQM